jgi:DNA polymerase III epsilon subunit-like protein
MALDLERCWTEVPIVVIDTETTGLAPPAQICEIAAVRLEAGKVVAEFSSLVRPTIPIPAVVTRIHGITDAMVADARSLEEAASGLCKVSFDAIPCAFNAPFDRRFLHASIQGTDCPAFDPAFPWLDVFVIVSSPNIDKFQKGPGRLKLGACCQRHGVEHQSAHRALGDARATAALLWALHVKGLVKPCTAQRLLAWGAVRRQQQDADHSRYQQRQAR